MKWILGCLLLTGCVNAPSPRPEVAGPPMRPGAWRVTDEVGTLPWMCVRPNDATWLIMRLGHDLCTPDVRWRREANGAWLFESRCGGAEWGQFAVGRAVGDFRTGFAVTARIRNHGLAEPALNGDAIIRMQGRYVASETCPNV